MTTLETSKSETSKRSDEVAAQPARGRPWGWIVAIVAVVCLAIGGVVGWLVRGGDEAAGDMPAEVEQLLDEFVLSWEEQDYEGFSELVTEDFLFVDRLYQPLGDGYFTEQGESNVNHMTSAIFASQNDIEWLSDPVVVGDGPWFVFVTDAWVGEFLTETGVSTYVVVDDGGTPKVANHTWIGTSTQPD